MKHLCYSCVHEGDENNTCIFRASVNTDVKNCNMFSLSKEADLSIDAIQALQKLVEDKRIKRGLVVRAPGFVKAVTIPELPPDEIVKEMQNKAHIRRKKE